LGSKIILSVGWEKELGGNQSVHMFQNAVFDDYILVIP
jgi:hypothetical protein